MAKEKIRPSTTSRTSRTCARPGNVAAIPPLLSLLAIPSLLTTGTVSALCNATFEYPTSNLTFFYLDTINVTYQSNFSDPQLSLYCSASSIPKFTTASTSFNGSLLVHINLTSSDPCYFALNSSSAACGVHSPSFVLSSDQRLGGTETTLGLPSPSPTTSSTAIALAATAATTTLSRTDKVASTDTTEPDALSPGAKVGLGIGITGVCLAIGAMVAFFYFRRRRRAQDAHAGGSILDHDRRRGKKGPEKRPGSESASSERSEEPLNSVQPIFDGFPGSTGYDDVRSLHSSTHLHSPTWPQSPSSSYHGAFFPSSERSAEIEELEAARLHSSATLPTVVSYGPNRVTPTLTPRPSDMNVRAGSISIDSREGIPPMPAMPDIPVTTYATYQAAPAPQTTPSPPKKTVPLVVSYGPNKVTPTPVIKSSIPPPSDAVMRDFTDWAVPTLPLDSVYLSTEHQRDEHPQHQELDTNTRRFSFEGGDGFYSPMGPLPPYASTADFYAMEKGAIRKMTEPQAQAELPPTKDGYYHDRVDVQEYELPGAAPQNAPQLPFNPFRNQTQASGSSREIDEQKFLLDDAEMAHLREQKRKIRAAQVAAAAAADVGVPGEAYEMMQTGYPRSTPGPS